MSAIETLVVSAPRLRIYVKPVLPGWRWLGRLWPRAWWMPALVRLEQPRAPGEEQPDAPGVGDHHAV